MTSSRLLMLACTPSIILLLHCGSIQGVPQKAMMPQRLCRAYGREWKIYTIVETKSKTFPELLTGERSSGRSIQYIETDNGEKINIRDSIYSLSSNGKYEKYYRQPEWAYASISILGDDDKLYIMIRNKAENVTNCRVHPPLPYMDGSYSSGGIAAQTTIFFGHFDPKQNIFFVDEYVDNFDSSEYRSLESRRDFDELIYMFHHRVSYRGACD